MLYVQKPRDRGKERHKSKDKVRNVQAKAAVAAAGAKVTQADRWELNYTKIILKFLPPQYITDKTVVAHKCMKMLFVVDFFYK